MSQFSLYSYECLPDAVKLEFSRELSQRLALLMTDIKTDDVLDASAIDIFVQTSGASKDASSVVSKLYSQISGGIQAGSGNQSLFNRILNAFVESWNKIM